MKQPACLLCAHLCVCLDGGGRGEGGGDSVRGTGSAASPCTACGMLMNPERKQCDGQTPPAADRCGDKHLTCASTSPTDWQSADANGMLAPASQLSDARFAHARWHCQSPPARLGRCASMVARIVCLAFDSLPCRRRGHTPVPTRMYLYLCLARDPHAWGWGLWHGRSPSQGGQ